MSRHRKNRRQSGYIYANPVDCKECGKFMLYIYDPALRDTCEPCGGKSKRCSVEDLDKRVAARDVEAA